MILYNIKTFFKRYLFYKNDFKKQFESLKKLSLFLDKNNIQCHVCGGFSVFLLENKAYRKCKDIDLDMEPKDARRLMDILYENKINLLKKHRRDEFFFHWKGIEYNVYPVTKSDGVVCINDEWQDIILKVPEDDFTDKKYVNPVFDKYKIKIRNPAVTFIMMGLTKNEIVKKLNFYYLKKYVSGDTVQRILELNPQYRDIFDFSLLNYSLIRWLKDELHCVLTNFRS